MTHEPTLDDLIELALEPESPQGNPLRDQVVASPRHRERLHQVTRYVRALAMPVPPAHLVSEAQGLLSTARPASSWIDSAARTIASLLPPSAPIMPGFRGAALRHHFTFTSPLAEIDLALEPGEETWTIRGQIDAAGPDPAHSIALVRRDDQLVTEVTAPDARGSFTLACDPGDFDLLALVGSDCIVAPELRVG